MRVHPRHRGDCADFFSPPEYIASIEFTMPHSTLNELEQAAAQAGRTWNEHMIYVLELCRGHIQPDFGDRRSAEEWRTLLSGCRLRFNEGEEWRPITCLWWKT